jgi:hypothetical protein
VESTGLQQPQGGHEIAKLKQEVDSVILVAGSATLVQGLVDSKTIGAGVELLTYQPA